MAGFVVNYEKELREAFSAGKSAGMAIMRGKPKNPMLAEFVAAIPKTYDEWIASKIDRQPVMRG